MKNASKCKSKSKSQGKGKDIKKATKAVGAQKAWTKRDAKKYMTDLCTSEGLKVPATLRQIIEKLHTHFKTKSQKLTHSSYDKPLTISAQQHLDMHLKGDLHKASPQWVKGANDKVKLMIPATRGSKGGMIIRWVNHKG